MAALVGCCWVNRLAAISMAMSSSSAWTLSTETAFVLLAAGAIWLRERRWAAWTLMAAVVCTVASYLPYVVFADWSYLRFLLPALPLVLVLAASVFARLCALLPRPWPATALVVVGLGLAAFFVRTADVRYVFELQRSEAKFRFAGDYVRNRLPAGAVVFTIWHSGSVRYYGERMSVVWDALPAADLDAIVAFFEARGRPAYFLFEVRELARFQQRFEGASRFATLDWPPAAVLGREVRLYRASDRQAYYDGHRITVDRPPVR